MMSMIFMMLFMIPMSFMNFYWLNSINYLMVMILFIIKIKFSMSIYYYNLGMDIYSYLLVLLTIYICFLMLVSSVKIYFLKYFYNFFNFINLMILISLVMVFLSMNIFLFYFFFEFSLIPVMILIIGWGYQPERIEAGVYLFIYTMLGSLPMMMVLNKIYYMIYIMDFYFLMNYYLSFYYYLLMFLVLFIKMPLYMFHLWLPKAHVEAPVAGSMILAGILLKLGGYGIMRFLNLFKFNDFMNMLFLVFSLLGSFMISLLCLRQVDMKSLIAYSSVAHMGMVTSGLLTYNLSGLVGAFIMMIAHGLCSSSLFVLSNIIYERIHSRSLFIIKGMINFMPSMSLFWFIFSVFNMSAPPSLNLLGELMLLMSIMWYSKVLIIILMLILMFSGVYSIFLYSISQHGKNFSGIYSFSNGSIREFYLLVMHLIPLILLVFKMDVVI